VKPCLLLLAFSVSISTAAAIASAPVEHEEISYLLTEIGSSGCAFVRNGRVHDSQAAAAHLAMKYRRARRHVADAEQFIERIASGSSWSGDPYFVDCDGDARVTSADWLHATLTNYR